MSELLPAPFGPNRPNMRLPIVSERFLSALTPLGYVLDRPVMVSAKRASSDSAASFSLLQRRRIFHFKIGPLRRRRLGNLVCHYDLQHIITRLHLAAQL